MKSRLDAPSPELARALATYATWVGGEVEAKVAEIGRHRVLAAKTLDASAVSAEWRALQEKRLGDDAEMLRLLDRVAPINAQVIGSLEGQAGALQWVVQSFLGLAQVLSEQRSGSIAKSNARKLEQSQKTVLWQLGQIQRALDAAGECSAAKIFPKAQLDAIAALAQEKIDRIHTVAGSRCRRALDPSVGAKQVERPRDAARVIGERLGDAELGDQLLAKHGSLRGPEKARFASALSAVALLADEAVNAPDYATTKMGWHHPNARSAYRRREHDAISRYQSQDRQERSRAKLAGDLQAVLQSAKPAEALERFLVQAFLAEIGAGAGCESWKASPAAIERALEHEAFVPLRALNETASEMTPELALIPEVKKAVASITQHIVEGDYREWRYDNPISRRHLSGMSAAQKEGWKANLHGSYRAGELELKTREEDDVELLWLTKIGGPSHGFDYGGRCLLPLLANGRTKAILVDDERWPHNAAARSYLRVLHLEDGSPTLYLEPFQRDFPHRAAFGEGEIDAHLYAAVISHAKRKADGLGLPLSIGADYREWVEALGIPATLVEKPLELKASNGVFEASDTLGLGHDFHQQRDLITPPLLRLEYRPPR
jgi:hypothetical protein